MITPEQCRAARMLLNWDQETLSELSKVSVKTISNFEIHKNKTNKSTLMALEHALMRAGIELINNPEMGINGVLLHEKKI